MDFWQESEKSHSNYACRGMSLAECWNAGKKPGNREYWRPVFFDQHQHGVQDTVSALSHMEVCLHRHLCELSSLRTVIFPSIVSLKKDSESFTANWILKIVPVYVYIHISNLSL